MDKPEHEDFKLSLDARDDDGGYAGELLEKKVDSLGWKVTLLTIVVPCLIAIIVIMAYFGITRQVADFQDTGAAEIEQLTNMYEEKLSSLRREQKQWQADADAERAEIKKETVDFEKRVGGGLRAVEKKSDQTARSLENLGRDVERQGGRIAGVEKKAAGLDRKVTAVVESVEGLREDLEKIKTAIDTLKTGKADQDEIDRRLAGISERRDKALQAATAEWEDRAAALSRKLVDLEKRLAAMEKDEKPGVSAPVKPLPDNGSILEENLSR